MGNLTIALLKWRSGLFLATGSLNFHKNETKLIKRLQFKENTLYIIHVIALIEFYCNITTLPSFFTYHVINYYYCHWLIFNHVKFSYWFALAIDHTFSGFTGVITHAGCWENTRKACKSWAQGEWFRSISSVLPTSQGGYHAGKPIESVVYCFYKITLKYVSVFYEFTGTINHRFLTNQAVRIILVIL